MPRKKPTHTPELIEAICEELAKGIPLTVICAQEGYPAPRTVRDWEQQDEAIAAAIARARELGEVALAEQCLAIADDETHDWELSKKGAVTNEVAIQRAKLRVDTRLKLLAKFNPKRWGDKVEHTGPGGGPVQFAVVTSVPEAEPAAPQGDDDA